MDKNSNIGDLATTIAHEGSHVADFSEYQSALLTAANSESAVESVMQGSLRITHGQSETRAYGVSSVFAEFLLGGGTEESAITSSGGETSYKLNLEDVKSTTVGGEKIWKSSWKKLDIEEIRSKRKKAIAKGLPKSSYGPILDQKLVP